MTEGCVGFIGVGRMGGPMASRLLDAGFELVVHDIDDASLAPLLGRGARRARSPADVASVAETVLVSLPTPSVVRAVALRANGVIAGSRVQTYIDLSTTGPRMAIEVAQGLSARGIVAVDAPVSGGVSGAQKGTLAVMVSGPSGLFARLPCFGCSGRSSTSTSGPGWGKR